MTSREDLDGPAGSANKSALGTAGKPGELRTFTGVTELYGWCHGGGDGNCEFQVFEVECPT